MQTAVWLAAMALSGTIFSSGARAQEYPMVLLHGSFENQLSGMWLRLYSGQERLAIYDYTRLRFDLDADITEEIQLRSDVVARMFVGETEFRMVDLIPKKTIDALTARDPRWQIAAQDQYKLKNELYVDNAYLKLPIHSVLVTVGKQPLEQGAGYAWNPTDLFTDKDMMDPTYEKPGIIALRTIIPIGEIASLDLIAVPDGRFETWAAGGRAALRLGPLSLSGASFVDQVTRTDTEGSLDAMMLAASAGQDPAQAVLAVNARRVLIGGDAVLDLAGIRFWTEGAYNEVADEPNGARDWWELSAGVEYFFESETHVMAEYFHYDRGPSQQTGTYDFNAWMNVLSGELKMLGQDFLLGAIDQPFADFWTAGFTTIQAFGDQSATFMADLRWNFIQDGELWLMLAGTAGQPEDFLSSVRAQGWLRLKVFF